MQQWKAGIHLVWLSYQIGPFLKAVVSWEKRYFSFLSSFPRLCLAPVPTPCVSVSLPAYLSLPSFSFSSPFLLPLPPNNPYPPTNSFDQRLAIDVHSQINTWSISGHLPVFDHHRYLFVAGICSSPVFIYQYSFVNGIRLRCCTWVCRHCSISSYLETLEMQRDMCPTIWSFFITAAVYVLSCWLLCSNSKWTTFWLLESKQPCILSGQSKALWLFKDFLMALKLIGLSGWGPKHGACRDGAIMRALLQAYSLVLQRA